MTSVELLAREHDRMLAEVDALLAALEGVARGDVDPGRLDVDRATRSWAVRPDCDEVRALTMADLHEMAGARAPAGKPLSGGTR